MGLTYNTANTNCEYFLDGLNASVDVNVHLTAMGTSTGFVDVLLNTPFSFRDTAICNITFVSNGAFDPINYKANMLGNSSIIRLQDFNNIPSGSEPLSETGLTDDFRFRMLITGQVAI